MEMMITTSIMYVYMYVYIYILYILRKWRVRSYGVRRYNEQSDILSDPLGMIGILTSRFREKLFLERGRVTTCGAE